MTTEPEALRLANALRDGTYLLSVERDVTEAALREQHAEIEELLEANEAFCRRQDRWSEKMFQIETEVEQLRNALYYISLASQNSMSSREECGRIARAALEAPR